MFASWAVRRPGGPDTLYCAAMTGSPAGRGPVPSSSVDPIPTSRVVAWGLWDWGSSAFNAVILTFVFSVYLTDAVGADLPGSIGASTWLGWGLGVAGVLVAVFAPVSGQRADIGGHRRRSLGLWTVLTVLVMAGMFFVKDTPDWFWLGLALLAVGSVFSEFAWVANSAMLRQVSTPTSIGRVSAFGWALGYFGGIVLLLICYFGFIAPDVGWFGVTSTDGLNIRVVALMAAAWFLIFGLPVLFAVPEIPPRPGAPRVGFLASYRVLWRDLQALWRTDRRTVWFLAASALFRDGLAGIFTFGGILAVSVYGISSADVILFAVAANVISALGALVAGRLDDRLGPKTVIQFSLAGTLVAGVILMLVSGPTMFWIFGLVLCLFVGPAQSSARTFLARLTPAGHEGELFGLYATTGRAVSFLAPTLFGFFTFLFDADRAGIAGILIVLLLGLLALRPIESPPRASAPPALAEQQGA